MTGIRLEALLMLGAGLAFGGALYEAFRLMSGRRVSFMLLTGHGAAGWLAAPLLMATGPIVLLRNNYRAFLIEQRPLRFVMAGVALAMIWSVLTGYLLFSIGALVAVAF